MFEGFGKGEALPYFGDELADGPGVAAARRMAADVLECLKDSEACTRQLAELLVKLGALSQWTWRYDEWHLHFILLVEHLGDSGVAGSGAERRIGRWHDAVQDAVFPAQRALDKSPVIDRWVTSASPVRDDGR